MTLMSTARALRNSSQLTWSVSLFYFPFFFDRRVDDSTLLAILFTSLPTQLWTSGTLWRRRWINHLGSIWDKWKNDTKTCLPQLLKRHNFSIVNVPPIVTSQRVGHLFRVVLGVIRWWLSFYPPLSKMSVLQQRATARQSSVNLKPNLINVQKVRVSNLQLPSKQNRACEGTRSTFVTFRQWTEQTADTRHLINLN